jgi:alanine dehydrogenase
VPTLLLTDRDVAELMPVSACIDVMADALRAVSDGSAQLPLRTILRLPGGMNAFGSMPAAVGDSIGAKIITVFPGNADTRFDSHIGVVLLFGAEHGELLAIADGSSITAIRTSAVSGLATKYLARPDAGDLAILGAGVLATPHLDAIRAVRDLRRVRVWSRSGSRAQEWAAKVGPSRGIEIEVCDSARQAVDHADIACTITSSRTPVLEHEWLAPGVHINAVGASLAQARELDSATMLHSRLYVDRRESTLAESGDFLIPRSEGLITDAHIVAELGDVVAGRVAGRGSPTERTLFKSLGLAVEDVASLRFLYERAKASGRGTSIELGGLRH